VGSKADTSLFIYRTKTINIYLLIYVDGIIIRASDPAAITELLQLLSVDFVAKDLGDLHYFLGVEVLKVESGLLSQRRYILDLLKKTKCTRPSLFLLQWLLLQVSLHFLVMQWKISPYTAALSVHYSISLSQGLI
jgi:hypothetical protein